MAMSQRERDELRRETVTRYHVLKDREEDFEKAKASKISKEELQNLSAELVEFRTQHREEDVRRGKRAPGLAIRMHHIMWARWIEIAAEHEAAAMRAFDAISRGDTAQLAEELRQSLVAITAAASTIEALYEDIQYLIPSQPNKGSAAQRISAVLGQVFGLPEGDARTLRQEFTWLFLRRNEGVHAYSEPEAPQPHPSGVITGAEASRFNGPESRRALEVALDALSIAENPPSPANRWVERWGQERRAYHQTVVAPIRAAIT